jgi:hypothetical protein
MKGSWGLAHRMLEPKRQRGACKRMQCDEQTLILRVNKIESPQNHKLTTKEKGETQSIQKKMRTHRAEPAEST